MRINQIIVESEQLDELGVMDIARGAGAAGGKALNAIGGVIGGVKGAYNAAKAGYDAGQAFVGGQRVGRPSGGATPAPTAAAAPTPSQQPAPSNIREFPSLSSFNDQDLEQLKGFIEREIRLRQSGNAPGSSSPSGGAAPRTPTTSPAGGAPASGATPPGGGSTRPTRNQIIQGPDGRPYQWLGNQWAAYNPTTGRAGQVARRDLGAQLTQAVASGSATPYTPPPAGRTPPSPASSNTPPTGGRPLPSPAGSSATPASGRPPSNQPPAAGPTPEPSPYGNVTADEQAFITAREREGASPEQINAALANRRTRQNRRPSAQDPAGSQLGPRRAAARPGDYDWVPGGGVGPNTRLGDIGPEGERTRNRQAAAESFHSRFLNREI